MPSLRALGFSYLWRGVSLHGCPSKGQPLLLTLDEYRCGECEITKLVVTTRTSSVQFSSVTQSYPTLFDPMDCSMPDFLVHHQLLELTQTHVHWVSDTIQLSHPLNPLLLLPSIFPSIRVFSSKSVLHIRWPKYWSFSFSISLSYEYSGLISFRMDCLDLLAVQGILKSLLRHHSSKASVLQCSAFFIVQLSHPYITFFPHSFD